MVRLPVTDRLITANLNSLEDHNFVLKCQLNTIERRLLKGKKYASILVKNKLLKLSNTFIVLDATKNLKV